MPTLIQTDPVSVRALLASAAVAAWSTSPAHAIASAGALPAGSLPAGSCVSGPRP
jgi:hypothetical protein